MTDALVHRGPDDWGVWGTSGMPSYALGNRRLSIVDLSLMGHQPMVDPITGTALVFNGMIYNYRELRSSLDYPWQGQSDTEVVLALWCRYGIETPKHLLGMFAFVLWDGKKLVLCRDRFGMKPLYWARTPEGTWLAASETRAIRAVAKFELNWTALAAYLRLGSVPSPLTAFQGIHELPPGHIAVIDGDGIVERPYWELNSQGSHGKAIRTDSSGRGNSGIPPLKDLFRDAVRSHLQADVPVALFCGGGTDSRAIAKTAADLGQRIPALTIVGDHHDLLDAKTTADLYTSSFSVGNPIPVAADDLNSILRAMDQPSVNGVNTWYASWLAKQHGFKVALSGVGGDELFGGYKTFRTVPRIRLLQSFIPDEYMIPAALRLRDALTKPRTFKTAYAAARGVFSKRESVSLTRGPLQDACRTLDLNAILPNGKDVREMELRAYLHNQLLRDTDVMSMAHGVEVRAPFLDGPFAEAAIAHPVTRKHFCRALDLPAPGPKRGFSLPIREWLDGPWADSAIGQIAECATINPREAFRFNNAHWSRRWALTVLAMWLKRVGI